MKRKIKKNTKGQFIIIAVLFIAIMIVSLGSVLYSTSTYYKYEPWEEYLSLVSNVELNCIRIVELSLSNYTQTNNTLVLRNNLELWKRDLPKIYPGYGVSINYVLGNNLGLSSDWVANNISFSTANASFELNITSLGLNGYRFSTEPKLTLKIHNVNENSINVSLTGDDGKAVIDLRKENFQVEIDVLGSLTVLSIENVTSSYDPINTLIYTINCDNLVTTPCNVSVWDTRGIKVVNSFG